MVHTIVISILVVLISVYMGKTLARDKNKETRRYKITVDILLVLILFVLAIGYGIYVYEVAKGGF